MSGIAGLFLFFVVMVLFSCIFLLLSFFFFLYCTRDTSTAISSYRIISTPRRGRAIFNVASVMMYVHPSFFPV